MDDDNFQGYKGKALETLKKYQCTCLGEGQRSDNARSF